MDKDKRKLAIIGSVGIPARYGGFETLAEQLSIQLSDLYSITVVCSGKKYTKSEQTKIWNNIKRMFIPLNANGIQSILYDVVSLIKVLPYNNKILLLGGSIGLFLPLFKPFLKNKELIFHPDGIEWKRQKWNSIGKIFLNYSIKLGCFTADKIIVDNTSLADTYSKYTSKTYFCSYGGDHLAQKGKTAPPQKKKKVWLTIARAEEENNLLLIAEAISKVKDQKWLLVSNYLNTSYGKKLFSMYNSAENITFIPGCYDTEALKEFYNDCTGYIHGHSAGGTNPTLTTAMWQYKPLLCHNNKYNRSTTNNKAYFFKTSSELLNLLQNTHYSQDKAEQAYQYAVENYKWKIIAKCYFNILEQ